MNDRNNIYLELVEMQSKCDLLSVHDSIELTELIKTGQCLEIAHHLMKLLMIADNHTTPQQAVKDYKTRLANALENVKRTVPIAGVIQGSSSHYETVVYVGDLSKVMDAIK